jgi:hypothetical protein
MSTRCSAIQGRSEDLHMKVPGCARQHHEVRMARPLFDSFRPAKTQYLQRCWLVYAVPSFRLPFRPMLLCAQAVNSGVGDMMGSDDGSSSSTSKSSSLRASTCGMRSITNAMKLDSLVSRSRHIGIRCRQARYVSTSDAPRISSIILVAHVLVFHTLWNLSMCCRYLLCRST